MDLAAVLGAMMKNNIWHWKVSLGERQSHDPSLFGELQPGRDFVKWNPSFSSTVDCAEGGQEWGKEATNIETFGYCYL